MSGQPVPVPAGEPDPAPDAGWPAVSIIVATRKRPAQLVRLMLALERQDYPPAVSPGIRSRTRTLASGGNGCSAARNAGARAASGVLYLFTDDDAEPEPDWARAMAIAHRASPGAALSGPIRALDADPPFARATELIDTAVREAHRREEGSEFIAGANAGFPAAGFREIGGFDSRIPVSEDREIRERWLAGGGEIRFVPGAVVAHEHPDSLARFWRVYFGYGRGAWAHHRRRAAESRLLPAVRTSGRTLRRAARAGRKDPAALARLAVWQLANVAGAIREAVSRTG